MTATTQGLDGVIAAETRLSRVDGAAGALTIAGYPVQELAPNACFEETVFLLWHDELPGPAALSDLRRRLAGKRTLDFGTTSVLREAADAGLSPITALRMAAATLDLRSPDAERTTAPPPAPTASSPPMDDDPRSRAEQAVAQFPVIVATYQRLLWGMAPIDPRPDLGAAANYLFMLTGAEPRPDRVRALDTYWNTVVDHGLNASTFAARVIISTRSDLVSAIAGAVGALKGPLHGGAPGPALDMVFEIGKPASAEPYLRAKLERGERLMGFGHRVYKVRDPRADVLSRAASLLERSDEFDSVYALAREVEAVAVKLLEEFKPGRRLETNVEFYTALLLHGIGLGPELFTPTFAASRVAGWCAHCFEQLETGRILRPKSAYVGETGRRWIPLAERSAA